MVLPEEMVFKYMEVKLLELYNKYRCHSYVSNNRALRWCPSAGCEMAVESLDLVAKEVCCVCNFCFCFSCGEESHRPTNCEIL